MNIMRIIFITISLSAIGGFYYLSYMGVMGESRDLDRSVRLGGPSGVSNGRVK
ncbi:hypothetical protein [Halocynthiibacter namhaensis]|uniref:hypothetical protein n=1 Tax=Halocynthiibacter namhaensis TaxID=1290553 RepID=UPI00192E6219|nr:hypothetical protein [Halocynthiibacter namhaensis]